MAGFYRVLLIAVALTFGAAVGPNASHANFITKGVKVYSAVQIARSAILVTRYLKQIKDISRVALDSRQIAPLKDCFKNRSCVSFIRNPKEWNTNLKNSLIKEWEKKTGKVWPRHTQPAFHKGKQIADPGDLYEAHHIVPKQVGGPHEWWNMHPVPRPEHQAVVHAAESFLNKVVQIFR